MCVVAFAVLSNNKLLIRVFRFGKIKFSMSGTKANGHVERFIMTSSWTILGLTWFDFHFDTHASCAISSIHSETFNSNRLAFGGSCGVMVAERIRQYRSSN